MSVKLNEFDENKLNSLISNIKLFNSDINADKNHLKKVIKDDSKYLESKYGISITLNRFKLSLITESTAKQKIVEYLAGFDLHSQLVIQGLGEYIDYFNNLLIDLEGRSLKDEFGQIYLKLDGFVNLEYVHIPDLNLYINCNSVLEKEIGDRLFTIYLVNNKMLFVDVKSIEVKKIKDKKGKKNV